MSESLLAKIRDLKKKRRAVILAHNYQPAEIQDVADFCGDSLGLSIQAARTEAETIVFCGVRFMAETAAILSPGRVVLLPDPRAGCPMADMITADQLRTLKAHHPGAVVVCYVNSTAEVKAECDVCCTSANAVGVVRRLPSDRPILFVPDQNLGQHVARMTGRSLVLWPGYCRTHVLISEDDIRAAKAQYPDAAVMVHPECTTPVRDLADRVLSTGQMLKWVKDRPARRFIVGTETGILHGLRKENPDADYVPANDRAVCPNMKKITLDKLLWALEDMTCRVTVAEDVAARARAALDRMLEGT